jgi:hypothetical protein
MTTEFQHAHAVVLHPQRRFFYVHPFECKILGDLESSEHEGEQVQRLRVSASPGLVHIEATTRREEEDEAGEFCLLEVENFTHSGPYTVLWDDCTSHPSDEDLKKTQADWRREAYEEIDKPAAPTPFAELKALIAEARRRGLTETLDDIEQALRVEIARRAAEEADPD